MRRGAAAALLSRACLETRLERSRSQTPTRDEASGRVATSCLPEDDVLRAFPEHAPAELAQVLVPLDDRREVVPASAPALLANAT